MGVPINMMLTSEKVNSRLSRAEQGRASVVGLINLKKEKNYHLLNSIKNDKVLQKVKK